MKTTIAIVCSCALAGCAARAPSQPDEAAELERILVRCEVPTSLPLAGWRLFTSVPAGNPGRDSGRLKAWRGSAIVDVRSAASLASLVARAPTAADAREFYRLVDDYVLDEGIAEALWSQATRSCDDGIAPSESRPRSWVEIVEERPESVLLERHAASWQLQAHVLVTLGPARYEVEPHPGD